MTCLAQSAASICTDRIALCDPTHNRLHNDGPAKIALALLLDRPDDTIAHGNRALVRTKQLTWLTAADAPGSRGRRTILRSAVAQLRNGSPALPFVPHPFPQHR